MNEGFILLKFLKVMLTAHYIISNNIIIIKISYELVKIINRKLNSILGLLPKYNCAINWNHACLYISEMYHVMKVCMKRFSFMYEFRSYALPQWWSVATVRLLECSFIGIYPENSNETCSQFFSMIQL